MKALIFILTFSLLIGCSTGNTYFIKGSLTGFEGIEWVYLQKLWSENLQVDSTRVKNEKFTFKGTIDLPEIYAVFPQPNSAGCQPVLTFILEPADLEIHLDTISMFNDGTRVIGGPENEEYNRVLKYQQEKFLNELDRLTVRMNEAGPDEQDSLRQKIQELYAGELKFTTDYIENHPDSAVSLYLLMWSYFRLSPDELGHLLSISSPEMQSTSVYKRIESDYQKQLQALPDN